MLPWKMAPRKQTRLFHLLNPSFLTSEYIKGTGFPESNALWIGFVLKTHDSKFSVKQSLCKFTVRDLFKTHLKLFLHSRAMCENTRLYLILRPMRQPRPAQVYYTQNNRIKTEWIRQKNLKYRYAEKHLEFGIWNIFWNWRHWQRRIAICAEDSVNGEPTPLMSSEERRQKVFISLRI